MKTISSGSSLISRTIVSTQVKFAMIEKKEGRPTIGEEQEITLPGKLDEKKVQTWLKKKFPSNTTYVVSIDHGERKYELPIEEFIAAVIDFESQAIINENKEDTTNE